jgi:hypothetical protein
MQQIPSSASINIVSISLPPEHVDTLQSPNQADQVNVGKEYKLFIQDHSDAEGGEIWQTLIAHSNKRGALFNAQSDSRRAS